MPTTSIADWRRSPWIILSIVLAVVSAMALTVMNPAPAQAANLVDNTNFEQGTQHWRTNGPDQVLQVEQTSTGPAAVLTTRSAQHAVLNDSTNTVTDTGPAGTTYEVSARVRGTSGAPGALRLREVAPGGAIEHETSFQLASSWKTVTLDVTTSRSSASLDLNVVAWSLQPSQEMSIDWVRMQEVTETPAPAPTEPCAATPPDGTLFGSHMTTGGISAEESLRQLDSAFGRIPVVRVFDPDLPFSWDQQRNDLLAGRTMVMSFRPMPPEVLSGQHDEYFRRWFAQAPDDRDIYWSYIHEPEPLINQGRFTAEQYKQAWRRLEAIAEEACKPNMYSTLILTGWTASPRSGRDYRTYDAGSDVIDVLAWDPYNGASDPDRDFYAPVSEFMAPAVETSLADGRPWGIAETGSRLVPGDAGQGRAAWLREVAEYAIANDAQFVTYFQSTRDGNWRLDDRYSRAVWREFVAGE